MSQPNKFRRQTVVIDRKLQHQLILRIAGLGAFYFTASVGVVSAFPIAWTWMFENSNAAMAEAAFRLDVLFSVVLLPLAVTFGCLWVHGIRETLKIAGPNYRFSQTFQELATLDLRTNIHLRTGDHLQDTAREYNQAVLVIRDQLQRARNHQEQCLKALKEARSGGDATALEAAATAAEQAAGTLRAFQLDSSQPTQVVQPMDEIAAEATSPVGTDAP